MVHAVKNLESRQTEKSASGPDVVTQRHHARIVENARGEHQVRFPANCEHLYDHLDEQTFLANTSRIVALPSRMVTIALLPSVLAGFTSTVGCVSSGAVPLLQNETQNMNTTENLISTGCPATTAQPIIATKRHKNSFVWRG
jgi:hypothetical protein